MDSPTPAFPLEIWRAILSCTTLPTSSVKALPSRSDLVDYRLGRREETTHGSEELAIEARAQLRTLVSCARVSKAFNSA